MLKFFIEKTVLNKKNTGKNTRGTSYNTSDYASNTTKSRSKPLSMADFVEKNEVYVLKEVAENKDEEKNDDDYTNNKRVDTKDNDKVSHTHTKSVNERFNTLSINDKDMSN